MMDAKIDSKTNLSETSQLNVKLRTLIEDLNLIDEKNTGIKSEQEKLKKSINEYKRSANELKKDLSDKQKRLDEGIEKIEAFQEEFDDIPSRLFEVENAWPDLARKADLEAIEKRLESIKKDNNSKNKETNSKITAINTSLRDVIHKNELEAEIGELRDIITERDERIQSLEKTIESLIERIILLEKRPNGEREDIYSKNAKDKILDLKGDDTTAQLEEDLASSPKRIVSKTIGSDTEAGDNVICKNNEDRDAYNVPQLSTFLQKCTDDESALLWRSLINIREIIGRHETGETGTDMQ